MSDMSPHIVAALLVRRDAYEPDDDLRALRRRAAETKASARPRRRYRFHRQESGWVTVSSARQRDEATTTTA